MDLKKKLGMGVLTGVMGLSLIGGGTYAAFNDTATVNNHFAAGTLDLEVGKSHNKAISFDLGNMKPGDEVQRIFTLSNNGSLAIHEVLLNVTADGFNSPEGFNDSMVDYLDQFEIDFMNVDSETAQWQPRANVVKDGETLTLADLYNEDLSAIKDQYKASDGSPRINLVPLVGGEEMGLPANGDTDDVFIQIRFNNDETRVGGDYSEFVQNKYQDNRVDFYFNLEATQWNGIHLDTSDGNGDVNNGEAHLGEDNKGNDAPEPIIIDPGTTHEEEVTDEQNNGGFEGAE